jgi:dephospho-CoA kinase
MDEVQIIALVGMPGSGKSSGVDYLTGKGFPSVYFGGITIDEVKHRGLEVNEANEKMVREELRRVEGKDAYAKRIIKQIEELASAGHKKIIVDGIYSWSEYKVFKDRFGDKVTIIAVAAPRHIRHQRLSNRPVRPLSHHEVNSRDHSEIENMEKGGPIANADYTIINDHVPAHMYAQIDKILGEVGFIS